MSLFRFRRTFFNCKRRARILEPGAFLHRIMISTSIRIYFIHSIAFVYIFQLGRAPNASSTRLLNRCKWNGKLIGALWAIESITQFSIKCKHRKSFTGYCLRAWQPCEISFLISNQFASIDCFLLRFLSLQSVCSGHADIRTLHLCSFPFSMEFWNHKSTTVEILSVKNNLIRSVRASDKIIYEFDAISRFCLWQSSRYFSLSILNGQMRSQASVRLFRVQFHDQDWHFLRQYACM